MRSLLLLPCLALLMLSGCPEDEFFQTCPLAPTIIDTCRSESTTTKLTCVVANHPMCTEHVCASWEDSETFCSRVCESDSDCPVDSTCQTYLAFDFCVPNAVTEGVVAP